MKYHQYITIALTLAIMPAMGEPIDRAVTDSQGRTLNGTILGRKGESIRFRRQSDGKEFAINMNSLSPKDYEYLSTLPEGSYDKMVKEAKVEEGKRLETINTPDKVFLALPFDKQDRGGICTAAALLNVLQYVDPTLKMDQEEMFTLFNSGRSGANYDEMEAGIRSLGYESEHLIHKRYEKEDVLKKIKESLSNNIPALVGTSSHLMVIVGFDNTDPKHPSITVWDQKKGSEEGDPVVQTIDEDQFHQKYYSSIVIKPNFRVLDEVRKADFKITLMFPNVAERNNTRITEYQIIAPERTNYKTHLQKTLKTRVDVEQKRKRRVFLNMGGDYMEVAQTPRKRSEPWILQSAGTKPREWDDDNIIGYVNSSKGVFLTTELIQNPPANK